MTKNVILFLTGAAVAAIMIVFGVGLGLSARAQEPGTPVTNTVSGQTIDVTSLIREADNRPDIFSVLVP